MSSCVFAADGVGERARRSGGVRWGRAGGGALSKDRLMGFVGACEPVVGAFLERVGEGGVFGRVSVWVLVMCRYRLV